MNYAVILAGGIGSRFWPVSRLSLPKQFMNIAGHSSLLQDTLRRIRPLINDKNIYIVANKTHLGVIRKQIKDFSIPGSNIILEPRPVNTAASIGICAQLLRAKDKDAILLIFPSDHHIKNNARFRRDILKAVDLAKDSSLVTLGIRPNRPHSGYGYIKTGLSLGRGRFRVKSFIEKPSISKAKKIYKRKDIFWNAGIFCWKADIFLEELKKYLPEMYGRVIRINNKADISRFCLKVRPVSVDYGVLEKSKRIALVAAGFTWSDLGSWDALCEVLPKDENNNIILADCLSLGSKGNIVLSKTKRLIATVGLANLIIVDTPDALLVCSRDRSQDVKTLVDCLKNKKREVC